MGRRRALRTRPATRAARHAVPGSALQPAGARRRNLHHVHDVCRLGRQHDDAIGQRQRLVDVVGHEQDRLAGVPPQVDELPAQPRPRIRIERRKRFVHEDDVGLEGQRPGDCDALALAAGEHRWHLAGVGREPHAFELPKGARAAILHGHGGYAHLQAERGVFECVLPRQETRRLEHVGEPRPQLRGRAARHQYGAVLHRQQIPDQPQRRRFAASGRTEKADELSVAHVEAERVIDGNASQAQPDPLECDGALGHHNPNAR